MARDLKVKLRIDADTKNADKSLKTFNSRIVDLGKNVLAPIASFAALTAIVAKAGIEFVAAARQVGLLEQSLLVLGTGTAAATSAIRDQASALSSLTEFTNSEILAVSTRISAFTKEAAVIDALTQATLDLAVGRSIGLVEASEAIAKSFGTAGNVLSEYGIIVDEAAGTTARLTQITDGIAARWDGAAKAAADNFTDSVVNLGAALSRQAATTVGLVSEQDTATEQIQKLTQEVDAQTRAFEREDTILGKLFVQFGGFFALFAPATVAEIRLRRAAAAATKAIEAQGNASETAAEKQARLTAETAALAVENEKLAAALKLLGPTQDEINEKLEFNEKVLIALDEQYRKGAINLQQLEERELRVNEASAKLNGTFVETVDVVGRGSEVVGVFSTALRENLLALQAEAGGLRLVNTEFERGTVLIEARSRATQGAALGTQTIFGQQTTKGGTFSFPDEVVGGSNGIVQILRPGDVRRGF